MSTFNIGSAKIHISADNADLINAFKQSSASVKDFAKKTETDLKTFSQSTKKAQQDISSFSKEISSFGAVFKGSFLGSFSGAALAQGITASIGAISNFIKEGAEMVGVLTDMSDALKISVGDLTAWSITAQQSGANLEDVTTALFRLQSTLVDASKGSEKQIEMFNALGLSIAQLKNLDPSEQLKAVLTALKDIQDPAERSALAMDAVGRSGKSLLGLINAVDSVDRVKSKIAELGINSKEAEEAMFRMDAATDNLAGTMELLKMGIMVKLAPAFEKLADSQNDTLENLIGFASFIAEVATNTVIEFMTILNQTIDILENLGSAFSGTANVIASAFTSELDTQNKSFFSNIVDYATSASRQLAIFETAIYSLISAQKLLHGDVAGWNEFKNKASERLDYALTGQKPWSVSTGIINVKPGETTPTQDLQARLPSGTINPLPIKLNSGGSRAKISNAEKEAQNAAKEAAREAERALKLKEKEEENARKKLEHGKEQIQNIIDEQVQIQKLVGLTTLQREVESKVVEARRIARESGITWNQEYEQSVRNAVQSTQDLQRSFAVGWQEAYAQSLEDATDHAQIARELFTGLNSEVDNIVDGFVNSWTDGTKSVSENFRTFAQNISRMLVHMALKAAFLNVFGSLFGNGIKAGSLFSNTSTGAQMGAIKGAFGSLPKYHTGGIVGLRPNEVPSILQKGEEVLTENDPRHRNNFGGFGSGSTNVFNTTINPAPGQSSKDAEKFAEDFHREVEKKIIQAQGKQRQIRNPERKIYA